MSQRSQVQPTALSRLHPPVYRYDPRSAQTVMRGVQVIGEVGGQPGYAIRRVGFSVWKYLLLILVIGLFLWKFVFSGVFLAFATVAKAVGIGSEVGKPIAIGFSALSATALSLWLVYRQWKLDEKRRSFGEARLMFNKAHFRAGDEISLEYERQLVQPRAEMGWAFLHLACVEVVATRQGTDTVYTETVLWQHDFDPAPLFMNRTLQRAYWHVALPTDLPSPAAGKDHWVTWHLQLHEDWEKGLYFTTNYALDIGPPKAEPAPAQKEGWGRH